MLEDAAARITGFDGSLSEGSRSEDDRMFRLSSCQSKPLYRLYLVPADLDVSDKALGTVSEGSQPLNRRYGCWEWYVVVA